MAPATPILFKNATIISYDTNADILRPLYNASLLVKNGLIAEISERDLTHTPADAEIIDATGNIISPGFIDTHHPSWQTQFRSMAANTYLQEYFYRYNHFSPANKHFAPEDVYIGQLAGLLELIDSGTTAVLDFAHGGFTDRHTDAALDACFESGLRVFYAHFLQPASHEMSFEKFKSMLHDERFAESSSLVQLGLLYYGWASAPVEQSMQLANTVFEHSKSGKGAPVAVLTSHYVAGPYGVTNSPTYLDSLPTSIIKQPGLDKKIPVILAHCSFMTTKDAIVLKNNPHVSIATCPEAEASYGISSHISETHQDYACLAVDTPFTFNSYMPSQARLWLQMLRDRSYRQTLVQNQEIPIGNPMSVEDAFLLMTKKGGEALGRPDLGVIREGAQADLVIFDCSRPSMWGVKDPVAAVVMHSCAGDIQDTMVAGKWVKKNGKVVSPLTGSESGRQMDVGEVHRKFLKSAKRIQHIWEKLDPVVFQEGETSRFGMSRFAKPRTVNVKRTRLTS